MTRVIDMADPARGDDPGEFQGYRHGAGVSFIVVRVRDATPSRRGSRLSRSVRIPSPSTSKRAP